jgi:hypothetical protein
VIFRRKARGASAVAVDERVGSEQLFEEIDSLVRENRGRRDPERERRLQRLRHLAGVRLIEDASTAAEHPEPDFASLPDRNGELPEIAPHDLTAPLLRAAILRDGCLLIRGLVDRGDAANLVEEIDRAFAARDAQRDGGSRDPAYYDELQPEPPFAISDREWTGSVWVPDSPRVMFDVLEVFERAGLRDVIRDYLGERPALSLNKCTLRRVSPDTGSAWHQDGAFLGDVRSMNVWLALSHCGDTAPGLDIVPRRLDHIVPTGTEGAIFDWSVAPAVAEDAAGDDGILRPIFEPGDVLLFDHLFLHATGVSPGMRNDRYAVESWFFAPSAFPGDYVPLAY